MQFLLVEPIAKTPYPPLGLLKISTMLRRRYRGCQIFHRVGNDDLPGLCNPRSIYITSLFTWDCNKVIDSIEYYKQKFPKAKVHVGGIAASLVPDYIYAKTGVKPHIGILKSAENCVPDYSLSFDRDLKSSISFTSRGCLRSCKFCNVRTLEPEFFVKNNWEKDIDLNLPAITFWDNNWLASPNLEADCKKLERIDKRVDFNQGLDARLFDENKAQMLSNIGLNPVRFAFDNITYESSVLKAIRLAKKYFTTEIRVYVLYNFKDTPEDFYHRIDLLNREGVLAFPMEYRPPTEKTRKVPGYHWDTYLLRAMKLTLLFYYRKGMITEKRQSFLDIYGRDASEFKSKLYDIYWYDKKLRKKKRKMNE
jgi:hypothetical protein